MRRAIRRARIGLPALVALVAAVAAAVAIAGVTVYSNDFSSSGEVKELRHAEGKHCKKDWRKKAKSLRVTAERGRTVCGYRPPVQGDSGSPNHKLHVETKLLKDTPKSVRDRVYVGAAVRSGKDKGYELQVFPTQHKFRLTRRTGDNVSILAKGASKAIKGINKPNVLNLSVRGSQLSAGVNGKRVAKVADRNSGPVDGRKLEIMLGYTKKRTKAASTTFDNLTVQVPKP
ncbi:MAG: hypothetical protein ACJ75I_04045 [Solirubrobacterales bacterium]